ncbi:MAG: putative methyltransferase [Parcubacteria group bacterium LiPW_39]|nr:MAG: putative methyltransferase [Parcubacteria group bacterium LiPW_39]
MEILAIVVLLFLILLLSAMAAFTVCLLWASFFTKVPFVPFPKALLSEVAKVLELNENSKLYDLGCGDGRVLIECHKSQPGARYVGIEKDIIPIVCAKIKLSKIKKPHTISILRKNFFKQNISDATHIFVYLSPGMMDALLPKLEKELVPGTRLVTCDFAFSQKEPARIINFDRSAKSRGKRLLVYEF